MARCPFCYCKINHLYIEVIESVYKLKLVNGRLETSEKVCDDSLVAAIVCPRCLKKLPLNYYEAGEFLKGKITLARVSSCTFKNDFAVRRGKVYRIRGEREVEGEKTALLLLEKIEDETVAAIVKASVA